MLKYVDTMVTFSEFPDEISLCINISNCPCHCIGCHSSYLAEDIGEPLLESTLHKLITENKGITCVGFMGGDIEPKSVNALAQYVKTEYNFDYIKIGPYIEEYGPLNNPNTNQRMYLVDNGKLIDITSKFWK